jgi:hypothetical protein
VSERSRQAVVEERIEKKPEPSEALPEPPIAPVPGSGPEPTPGDERKQEQPSPLDMIFREAEIIAQNLKESGTRR